MSKNYYSILGVDKYASDDDIKTAYRKLAVKYHPDKNKDKCAAEEFRNITEAYEILKDSSKRLKYDMQGTINNFSNNNYDFSRSTFNFSKVHVKRGKRGSDIRIMLEITLEEVLTGTQKKIRYKRYDKCSVCSGLGTLNQEKVVCKKCKGSGYTYVHLQAGGILFKQQTVCDQCGGIGKIVKYDCTSCEGKGIILSDCSVDIPISKGTSEDTEIVIKYYGHHGERNGISGNLIVKFKLKQHKKFLREQDNVVEIVKVPYSTIIFGKEIVVDTLKGQRNISILPRTNSHTDIIIPQMGLPNINDNLKYGDHIVRIVLDVPQELTDSQQKLINSLKGEGL